MVNKENASKLWKIIQEAGDYLQDQLPEHPNHPKGRNPYAHVAICVKNKLQVKVTTESCVSYSIVARKISVFCQKSPV